MSPATPSSRTCPQCGAELVGSAAVEDLCSHCLVALGLEDGGDAERREDQAAARPGNLEPVEAGSVATWMPADLIRRAADRIERAALGVALAGTLALVANLFWSWAGWHSFAHLGLLSALLVGLVALSAAVVVWARRGRVMPRSLIRVGFAFEILVAFAISIGDHLEPLPEAQPLATVSWLCLWIAIFPLVVPARPRWALSAGLASAATWPLAWYLGRLLGHPVSSFETMALNFFEILAAVGLAVFATSVVRRLQDLGCYRLLRKLDHGGMGEIWEARHRMLARPVAIKLMRPVRPSGLRPASPEEVQKAIQRFELEAQATAALRSPHTVELHDFGVTPEGVYYYVMELLEGLDLESLVEEHGPLPAERVVHLLVQACDSLAEAHANGLIHRDIKPGNIFSCHVGPRWDFVKVLDFGLVKSSFDLPHVLEAGSGPREPLTAEGTLTGTPAYIAPELALGRPLDGRVDIYGLGCVGYWLVTGERPFQSRSAMELVLDHVRTPPTPPSERLGEPVPEALEELILACMAKDPGDRPSSAEWVASRLAECPLERRWTRERAREWWEARADVEIGGFSPLSSTASLPPLASGR